MKKKISVIISVYNEEEALPYFFQEIKLQVKSLRPDYEIELLFVNDGSTDESLHLLKEFSQNEISAKVISFSRNFGHEAAMLAGLKESTGDVCIVMDADCQHPPKLIPKILERYLSGNDIVLMKRIVREDGGVIRKTLTNSFYDLFNKFTPYKFEKNVSDFFMLSRRVVNHINQSYLDQSPFLRGYIQNIGFNTFIFDYEAPKRMQGESKYPLLKLFYLSISALVSFTKLPLHLGIVMGAIMSFFSLILIIYSVMKFLQGEPPPGYTTLVVFISVVFTIQFYLIGFIGLYVGFNFNELKNRPRYIIDETIN